MKAVIREIRRRRGSRLCRKLMVAVLGLACAPAPAADCNANGIEDASEIATGTAADCDEDGVPDACELVLPAVGFDLADSHGAGNRAEVAAVDLGGDGIPDIVALPERSNTIALLRGVGDGTFEAPRVLLAEASTFDVADIDGDGDVDLLTVEEERVSFLENTGDGRNFAPQRELLSLSDVRAVTVSDLDGDGLPDLLTSLRQDDLLSTWIQLEGGSFELLQEIPVVEPVKVTVEELDGDGVPDLVVPSTDERISVFRNRGDGRFVIARTIPFDDAPTGPAVVADLDGDGEPDLAVPFDREMRVGLGFLGDVATPFESYWARGRPLRALSASDIDGDGDLDLVSAKERVVVYLNDGEGRFDGRPLWELDDVWSGDVADLDLDGADDLVIARDLSLLLSLLNTPQATPGESDCNQNGVPDSCDVIGGDCGRNGIPDECEPDCDFDGNPDLCQIERSLVPLDCNGDGVIDSCQLDELDCDGNGVPDECDIAQGAHLDCDGDGRIDECEVAAGEEPDCNDNGVPDSCDLSKGLRIDAPFMVRFEDGVSAIATADFDGDGLGDVLGAEETGGEVLLFRNAGPRGFLPPVALMGLRLASTQPGLVALDAEGDGDHDAVLAAGLGHAFLLLNDGSGSFPERRAFEVDSFARTLAAGDLTGDGIDDIAFPPGEDGDAVALLLNRGDGTFISSFALTNSGGVALDLVDVDADGDLDIALVGDDESAGSLNLLINTGGGRFLSVSNLAISPSPGQVLGEDLDEDGDQDLVILHPKVNGVTVLLNGGGGTFGFPLSLPAGAGASSAAVLDVDGDSRKDIMVANLRARDLTWLRQAGPGSFEARRIAPRGRMSPLALEAADLDLDGVAELVMAEVGEPSLVLWRPLPGGALPQARRFGGGEDLDGGAVSDLDGDGDLDVVLFSERFHEVRILENDGSGRLELTDRVPAGRNPSDVVASDIDLDGDVDLVLGSDDRSVLAILVNSGDAAFELLESSLGHTIAALEALDVDDDGDHDLAALDQRERRLHLLVNVGGAFEPAGPPYAAGDDPESLMALDLSGDGRLDLVVTNRRSRLAVVLENRGDGTLETPVSHFVGDFLPYRAPVLTEEISLPLGPVVFSGSPELVADIDEDGRDEIFLPTGESELTVLQVTPASTLRIRSSHLVGFRRRLIGSGDLDGDGAVELVFFTEEDGDENVVVVGIGSSAPRSTDRNGDGIPDDCFSGFFRGDTNGDGSLDITDVIGTLGVLFRGEGEFSCLEAADANNDSSVDLSDAVFVVGFLFLGEAAPPAPGPPSARGCGVDPDAPGSPGDLGCENYLGCAAGR